MKRELAILAIMLSFCSICAADVQRPDATAVTGSTTTVEAKGIAGVASGGVGTTHAAGIQGYHATIEGSSSGVTSGTTAGSVRGYATGSNSVYAGSSAGNTGTEVGATTSATVGGRNARASTDSRTNVNTDVNVRVF